jgi:hypothetical protein
MNIEKEIKTKLKDYYTKEEVYNIFKDFISECIDDKSNTLDTYTALKCQEKFYVEVKK